MRAIHYDGQPVEPSGQRLPDVAKVAVQRVPGVDDPADANTPPLVLNVRAVIALRAGRVRGPRRLSLHGRFPSGAEGLSADKVVTFSDDRPAVTLNLPLELELPELGTYVFDVLCDGTPLTAITLEVRGADVGRIRRVARARPLATVTAGCPSRPSAARAGRLAGRPSPQRSRLTAPTSTARLAERRVQA